MFNNLSVEPLADKHGWWTTELNPRYLYEECDRSRF